MCTSSARHERHVSRCASTSCRRCPFSDPSASRSNTLSSGQPALVTNCTMVAVPSAEVVVDHQRGGGRGDRKARLRVDVGGDPDNLGLRANVDGRDLGVTAKYVRARLGREAGPVAGNSDFRTLPNESPGDSAVAASCQDDVPLAAVGGVLHGAQNLLAVAHRDSAGASPTARLVALRLEQLLTPIQRKGELALLL